MSVSEFCIRRPVATLLMSMALIVGGLFAFGLLPVAALPHTDFPTINVSAASGVTGAGYSAKPELLFAEVAEDFRAYSVGNQHHHLAEMQAVTAL